MKGPPRILVVDDEEAIRELLVKILTKNKFLVEVATDGAEGLEKVRQKDYDVVLTDMKMPRLNGMKLLELVKQEKPYIEVIMITAFGTIDTAVEAMKKGAYDFILKPVDVDQVPIVIDRCLEKMALSEENRQLRLINEKLQELREMKDKFTAIVSHELRTPVSVIKSYLDMLLDGQCSEKEQKDFLKTIAASVAELEEIVADMDYLTSMDSSGLRLNYSLVPINQIIRRVVKEFSSLIKERELRLSLEMDTELPPIPVDDLKIRQALIELVQNAIKYTPDGGEIKIISGVDNGFLTVTVADTGIGIAEGKQRKIFERFYEVQDTLYHHSGKTEFMSGGIGLGLPVAKGIVEAHGGRIQVESKEGEGSKFTIFLPLKAAQNGRHQMYEFSELC